MIDLREYGWQGDMPAEGGDEIPARVTAVYRDRFEVMCARGPVFGRLKTSAYGAGEEYPTAGDFVLLRYQNPENGDSLITGTMPRRSWFSRRSKERAGNTDQAVAANFDAVFITTSLNRDFNPGRLERYLTLAWQSGAQPVVVLTKSDLTEDCGRQTALVQGMAAGVDVVPVSAYTGQGLERLDRYLPPGKTAVLLGSSGVGKSSLVNALAGDTLMSVNAIREDDGRGRHTTTHRQLIMLPCGAMVIDTPGMRELGMWDVSEGLGEAFSDVEAVLERGCRFTDCGHRTEPGCAVKEALRSGELSAKRWQSYQNLAREARYSDDKTAFMRDRQQRHKQLARFSRQRKKNKH